MNADNLSLNSFFQKAAELSDVAGVRVWTFSEARSDRPKDGEEIAQGVKAGIRK